MEASDTLVVFVRHPIPGRTKTRLAARIGEDAAARLYDAFVRDLVGRFAGAAFAVRWDVAPPDPGFAERFGVAPGDCGVQTGEDLGARMRDAFARSLTRDGRRCVLIGSDAPHLPLARVEEAFERLSACDVVLGPAMDGGYYLIGMRRPHELFSGISWSTSSVLAQTMERAGALGLEVIQLEEDFDVDETEDLDRLRTVLDAEEVRCPATARALRDISLGSI